MPPAPALPTMNRRGEHGLAVFIEKDVTVA
jgi:hypothetical protein